MPYVDIRDHRNSKRTHFCHGNSTSVERTICGNRIRSRGESISLAWEREKRSCIFGIYIGEGSTLCFLERRG